MKNMQRESNKSDVFVLSSLRRFVQSKRRERKNIIKNLRYFCSIQHNVWIENDSRIRKSFNMNSSYTVDHWPLNMSLWIIFEFIGILRTMPDFADCFDVDEATGWIIQRNGDFLTLCRLNELSIESIFTQMHRSFSLFALVSFIVTALPHRLTNQRNIF